MSKRTTTVDVKINEERERVLDDLDEIFGSPSDDETSEHHHHNAINYNNLNNTRRKDPYKIDSGFGKFSLKARLLFVFLVLVVLMGCGYVSIRMNKSKSEIVGKENILVVPDGPSSTLNNFERADYTQITNRIRHLVVNQYASTSGVGGLIDPTNDKISHKQQNEELYSKLRFHNSAHHGNGQSIDFSQASFVMENVCMNKKGDLIFYTTQGLYDSVYKQLFGITHNEKVISFLQTWRSGKRGSVNLNFMFKKTNKDFNFIQNPTIAMNRYAAGSLAHFFNDNLIALNELIYKFDLDVKDLAILFMDEIIYERGVKEDSSCETSPSRQVHLQHQVNVKTGKHLFCAEEMSTYHGKKKEAIQQSLQWTQIFSTQPILQKCSYKIEKREMKISEQPSSQLIYRIEKAPCPMDDPESKRPTSMIFSEEKAILDRNQVDICFKKLVFGVGERSISFGKNYGKYRDISIQLLRKRIISNLGLLGGGKPKKTIKIVVLGKLTTHESNNIFNSKELEKKLENLAQEKFMIDLGYSVQIIPLDVSSATSSGLYGKNEENSLIQMVRFFSSVDVFITNSGSASYWSLFMPENSHLIITPFCPRQKQAAADGANKVGASKQPSENKQSCHEPSSSSLAFHHSLSHMQVLSLTQEDVKASHFTESDPLGQVEIDIERVYNKISKLVESRFI